MRECTYSLKCVNIVLELKRRREEVNMVHNVLGLERMMVVKNWQDCCKGLTQNGAPHMVFWRME